MTQPSSLTSATNWKIELSKHLSHNDANLPVLLIGNKVCGLYIRNVSMVLLKCNVTLFDIFCQVASMC